MRVASFLAQTGSFAGEDDCSISFAHCRLGDCCDKASLDQRKIRQVVADSSIVAQERLSRRTVIVTGCRYQTCTGIVYPAN